jgi:hypothetical protein
MNPSREPFTVWALRSGDAQVAARDSGAEIWEPPSFRLLRPRLFESRRLVRQFGCFSFFGLPQTLESYAKSGASPQLRLKRYDISGDDWVGILRELRFMGISAGNLYDALDGVAHDVLLQALAEHAAGS